MEKTVKITSGSSILILQHYALIYNFDVKFVEILVFLIFLKTGWDNLREEIVFVAVAQGFSLRFACERPQDRSSPKPKKNIFLFFFYLVVVFFSSNHPFIGID